MDIRNAIGDVENIYKEITEISEATLAPIFNPIDKLIGKIRDDSVNMSIDQIRDYMLQLSLQAYSLSEIKEKSLLKAEAAEALRKERYSSEYNLATGAVALRENTAVINSQEQVISEKLYNYMAGQIKTKLDELHRMIDVLKSNSMSRMQEAKFANMSAAEDPDQYLTPAQVKEWSSYRVKT